MKKHLISPFFSHSLLLIIISSLGYMLPWGFPLFFSWSINILLLIYYTKKYHTLFRKKLFLFVNLFIAWTIISFVRGILLVDDYWSLKNLIGHSISLLIPSLCVAFTSPQLNKTLLYPLLKYGILLFPLFYFLCQNSDGPGRYLSFLYLFIIFISILPFKWKIIIISLSLIAIFYDIEARSGGLRILAAFIIGLLIYIRNFAYKLIKILHPIIMITPFILLYLGCSGVFNIFKLKEYTQEATERNNNLLVDTRSFLYEEVILSSINNNYIISGRTPTKGYDSKYFVVDQYAAKKNNMKILNERGGCEVSILNIYTYIGLIGVIIYYLIFYSSSYLAIYKSNNIYIKLLGVFITFRWLYAWVEDFNNFDINYVMIWFMIGMCYSTQFRNMNNCQFKKWVISTLPFNK